VATAVQGLRKPLDAATYGRFDVQASHDLFIQLFGPVREKLTTADHIIIVPIGPLLSLPPAA